MRLVELTKKEKQTIVREMTERCKDIVYMNATRNVRKALNQLKYTDFENNDKIEFTYYIGIVIGDLIQILGRKKRDPRKVTIEDLIAMDRK